MAQHTDTQKAWNQAIREIRKHGVVIKQNVQSCCNSCITNDDLGMESDSNAYAYTFGGQGQATKWVDDVMVKRHVSRYESKGPVKNVYIHHGNGSAELVVATFREFGFPVEWNEDEGKCVNVTPILANA